MLGTLSIVGVVVVAGLLWFYMRARSKDVLTAIMEKRRGNSRLVSAADYAEGMDKIPVAMALTSDNFYYENSDLQASFELGRIDEIEYDNELATGRSVDDGYRVLRLRSHGATFEFIMPEVDIVKWQAALPGHILGQTVARVS